MTGPREEPREWYVIQNPHRNAPRVIAGPTTKREAVQTAAHADFRASIIHTPSLLHIIHRDGVHVAWDDPVEPPADMEVATP